MDWKRLADRAKQVVDKRGGPQSVREDAEELLDIAKNRDSTSDKFKEAVEAIKEPGAGPHEPGAGPQEAPSNPQHPPQDAPDNPEQPADNPPQDAPDNPSEAGSSG